MSVALVGLAVLPTFAYAQSAIAGVVKDASGGVLPGVTVEAASPVLIEKSHTVVTDAQGEYKIVDLRPGTYTVTFTLEGFTTMRRDGLELPSNFTATVNMELRIGALQETLTVSGASPVIDTHMNVKQQVLPREVLDAVPTAHTIQSMGQLIVGVQLTAPDVGGSQAGQQTYMTVHGSTSSQTVASVDGMMINGTMAEGGVQAYFNDQAYQEMVYQTGSGTAEAQTMGVQLNLVPKDGGSAFRGSALVNGMSGNWQANNLSPFLATHGVTSVDRTNSEHDLSGSFGGPIVQEKLWFLLAGRQWSTAKPVANTHNADVSQGVSDERTNNTGVRLTWQMSERNKFSVFFDRAFRFRGHAMSPGDDPASSSVVWHTPTFAIGGAKWTAPISNRLLLEAGFSFNRERYDNKYQPGIEQPYGSPGWYSNVRRVDNGLGTSWGASAYEYGNYPDKYNAQASASYVTGSHHVKVGFVDSWSPYRMWATANGDLYENYTNGAPVSVTVLNTPINWEDDLNANFGVFAQDAWTLKRMTISFGLRWDYVSEQVAAEPGQTGRFANEPAHGIIQMPTWKSWSPRASVVYDVFGNGKTAIRFGFNRYETASTTGLAQMYDPTAVTTASLPWTDLNHDGIAQGSPGCVYQTVGCEINFAQMPRNFGVLSLASPDPNIQRPYSLQYNLGIHHELLPGVSVSAEWFHVDFKNIMIRNNVLRNADSYTPVTIASPIDGSAITVYNVKTAYQSLVQNVDSTDPNLKQWYNGFEFNVNVRLPHGVRIFGGSSTERTMANSCDDASTNPNRLLYCDQSTYGPVWRTQFKLVGTYPMRGGFNVSAALQALPGYLLGSQQALTAGFSTPAAYLDLPNGLGTYWQITPTTRYAANCLGACTPGALVVPGLNTATLNVPLLGPGTETTPRITELDLTLGRLFKVGRLSVNPKVDVFNALNSGDYYSVRSLVYGAAVYGLPGSVLQGRIMRLSADMRW
jgi:hypothetical protein